MPEHNAENERIKRRYFAYLKEANRQSESTVDAVAKALSRFEVDTRHRPFRSFHHEQAVAFKRRLSVQVAQRSGERLSKATLYSTLTHLKRFFHWLAGQPGFRSKFSYSDAEFFNLSEKEMRVATARREILGPTVEQVLHVVRLMRAETPIQLRDRALIAFTLVTGARDQAIASLKVKHLNLPAGCVEQDAREVKTKFSKTFTTFFFPVGDELIKIVKEWIEFLQTEQLWGADDPLFPATRVAIGPSQRFEAVGLARKHWRSAAAIRTVFRRAFEDAGLPYFNPHTFRNTLVRLGQSICQTPEDFKAWSQNLGHENVLTTLTSYGEVGKQRQAEILRNLSISRSPTSSDVAIVMDLIRQLKGSGRA
jgi:integrase